MDYKMEVVMLVLSVIPAIVTSITITSNGNSPEVKMVGGMMVDMQRGFKPMVPKFEESTVRNRIATAKKLSTNSTKLAINERYRRLIPYMTFYYANDLAAPTTATQKDVEVEKAQIFEAKELDETSQREPKKIIYSHHRNIPRYQGNRLTQHNIASANPTKIFYKTPLYQFPVKSSQNFNPLLSDYRVVLGNEYDSVRFTPKPPPQSQIFYTSPTRKPFYNLYNEENPNIRYFLSEKDETPKYKLVPYEQTPPHKVPETDNVYDITKKPVPVPVIPKEQVYLKPRPARPHYVYETVNVQQPIRKQPAIISESYFEKRPPTLSEQPIVHSGFKPLYHAPLNTETVYTTGLPEHTDIGSNIDHNNRQNVQIDTAPLIRDDDFKPNYYEYVIEPTTTYKPRVTPSNTLTLASLLNTLQLNKSIPKPVTKENVGSSIQTLLQVLNVLKAVPQSDVVEVPVLSTPKPFVTSKVVADLTAKPVIAPATQSPNPIRDDEDLPEQPYLAEVEIPSQHLDDTPSEGGTSQRFPLPVTSDDEGGTPGQPGVDYPILSIIPPTKFNCKTQRYKGFFADPETRCQVWHYCDLNGGQASFLCPNGTIFSQAALTCDWWHNVRCASTAQLYVLNESLYKYILPHSPKFPEDYSGPLVDKYLTLKFKEMEEEFRKKKNKHVASEKMDDSSTEASEEKEDSAEDIEKDTANDKADTAVSEPSVVVESPGTSGQVERLSDE